MLEAAGTRVGRPDRVVVWPARVRALFEVDGRIGGRQRRHRRSRRIPFTRRNRPRLPARLHLDLVARLPAAVANADPRGLGRAREGRQDIRGMARKSAARPRYSSAVEAVRGLFRGLCRRKLDPLNCLIYSGRRLISPSRGQLNLGLISN